MGETIEIPLKGCVALIDAADSHVLSRKWFVVSSKKDNYRSVRDRTGASLGREVLGAQRGQIVDHINGDTLDNRRSNLRFCTVTQNGQNKPPHKHRRFKGPYQMPGHPHRWYVHLRANGKMLSGGGHATEEDAARAYDVLAKKHFGEFARLNFPEAA